MSKLSWKGQKNGHVQGLVQDTTSFVQLINILWFKFKTHNQDSWDKSETSATTLLVTDDKIISRAGRVQLLF